MSQWLETPYEIIPSGENPIVNAQYVQCVDERLDEVLRTIGNDFETADGRISTNETNISTNTTAISGLDSRVTILEEQGGGGTSDYTALTNKPKINGNELTGNKTSSQLGLANASDIPSNYITGGSQTSTSSADGGSNVFTFTNANGTTSTFTVKNGSKGSQGIQGVQGEKGEKGDTGSAGTNGTNGTNGTSAYWFTGTAVTGTASSVTVTVSGSKAGDMYLNTSTWNVYTATAANTWKYCCNIRGAAGQNATTTAVATTSANGLMSTDHVTKLNGIATGATSVTTSTVAGWGYTKNAGTVTQVKVGTTAYDPSSGVVSLPAYPTTLPASDVSSWAKASTKPTYTASEVGAAASSHDHTFIKAKDQYTFTSATLPNSFDFGVSAGFVKSDSGFGSFGTVLTVRTYSGGGGTLQLYAPYGSNYGGTHIKARFGDYGKSSGNSWTDLKEVAWTSDIPSSLPASDVYSWAKASTKPTYTASEVGAVSQTDYDARNEFMGIKYVTATAGQTVSIEFPNSWRCFFINISRNNKISPLLYICDKTNFTAILSGSVSFSMADTKTINVTNGYNFTVYVSISPIGF